MIRKVKKTRFGSQGILSFRTAVTAAIETEETLATALEFAEGLTDPSVLHRPHKPDEVRFTDPVNGTCVICNDPGLFSAELRRLRSAIALYRDNVRDQWRRSKNLAMQALREECTKTIPKYTFIDENRSKVVRWTKHIRVLKEDAERLGILAIHDPIILGRILKDYRPSNPLKLGLGAHKVSIRVQCKYEKTVKYMAHVRRQSGTRQYLDRKLFKAKRSDWFAGHPSPLLSADPEYTNMRRRYDRLLAKERASFKRCYAWNRSGEVDVRACLQALRYSAFYQRITTVGLNTYGRNIVIPSGLGTHDGYPSPSVLYGVQRFRRSDISQGADLIASNGGHVDFYDLPSMTYTTTHNSSVVLDGFPLRKSGVEYLRDLHLPFLQPNAESAADAYDNAQLALENLSLGSDELDKTDFNVYRSTAELKDTRQTIVQVREFKRYMGTLSAKTTLKAAASAYLAWKFAVEPTISDINTLLKHTRQHILGVRRGLWQLVSNLNLFQEKMIVLRKYANVGLRLPAKGAFRTGFAYADQSLVDWLNEDRTIVHSEYSLPAVRPDVPDDESHVCAAACLPEAFRLHEDSITTQAELNRHVPLGFTPFWIYFDQRPLLFSAWKPKELLEALDPSRVANLVETMKLPKNVWELYPLSFVVDWLMTTGQVVRNIQNVLGSYSSDLVSESGSWISVRQPLLLAVPECAFEKRCTFTGATTLGTVNIGGIRGRMLSPYSQCVIQTSREIKRLRLYDTQVASYIRGPKGLPNYRRVLLPKIRVSLGGGQLTSLLAMLTSSL